jgi:predicted DNA-binding protein YlxM (UPF0122 family)
MANLHHSTLAYDPADFHKRDEYYELREKLIKMINDFISTKLTDRQSEVVQGIYYEQRTQMEMADKLGLCQTTIHKILKGNIDYSNGGKLYVGAEKKLKKLCKNNPEIQDILDRMKQIMLELTDC